MEPFSASMAFVWGIHWSPVNSPHKGSVMRTLMYLWRRSAHNVRQIFEWPVIRDYTTFMWRHRNASYSSQKLTKLLFERFMVHAFLSSNVPFLDSLIRDSCAQLSRYQLELDECPILYMVTTLQWNSAEESRDKFLQDLQGNQVLI